LGLIDLEKHYGTLQIKDKDGKFQNVVINSTPREILQEIASLDSSFDKEKVNGSEDNFKEVISYLRSKVINVLAHKCFEVFGNHYKTIMSGEFYEPLISCINDSQIIDGLFKMQSLVRRYVYNYKPVLKSEASGFEVMHSLIESLAISSNICISCGDPQDEKANKLRSLLPDEYSPKEEKELKNLTQVEIYERVMSVLDYVSGMTDNYAMSLFRSIKGISSH
jgi:dGTPase